MPSARPSSVPVRRTAPQLAALAIAHLALIVVGVSLALWADSRVELRKDRHTEAARLDSLAENVARTRARLELHAEEVRGVASALSRLLELGNETELPDTDVLERLIAYGFFGIADFNPELNAYEDLKSSGELSLLKDPEVRNALSAMDADTQRLLDARADLIQFQQRLVDPWLITNLDLSWLDPGLPDGAGKNPEQTGGSYDQVLNQLEFRNLAVFKLDLLNNITRIQSELTAALDRGRSAIDARLEELRPHRQAQQALPSVSRA